MKLFCREFAWFNRCNGTVLDRTSSMPMSVLRLLVDKGQALRSGILCVVLVLYYHPKEC